MNNDVTQKLTIEDFKQVVLNMENDNLSKIKQEERKQMVARIMRYYETLEGNKRDDNK